MNRVETDSGSFPDGHAKQVGLTVIHSSPQTGFPAQYAGDKKFNSRPVVPTTFFTEALRPTGRRASVLEFPTLLTHRVEFKLQRPGTGIFLQVRRHPSPYVLFQRFKNDNTVVTRYGGS